jgi:hypothetical protein
MRITRGWTWERLEAGPDAAARSAIRVGWYRNGYVVDSAWLPRPLTGLSEVGAACSVVCDLALAQATFAPEQIGLHCGAVEVDGQLVVLAGSRRAGKTTLTARLGGEPVRVFTDDVLPLSADATAGVATGIAPRLRLPLPRKASAGFRAQVAAWMAAEDGQYGYVMTPNLAPRGARAPIGAILLLDRRTRGPAGLRTATRAEALRDLVLRNLTNDQDPAPLLGRLEALVASTEVMWLTYSDLDEAAALVKTALSPGAGTVRRARRAGKLAAGREPAPRATRRAPLGQRYRQRAGLSARSVDGEMFLCDPSERAILHLDPVGAAVWTLLEGATSAAEAAELLAQAFPYVEAEQIAADVAALIDELATAGIVDPVEEAVP